MCPAVPIVLLTQEGAKKFGTKHPTCSSAVHRGLASGGGVTYVTVTYFWFNLCCSDGLQAEQCDPSAQFALPYGMVPSVCCSQGCQSQKGWEKFTVVLCIWAEYELLSQLYRCL